MRQIVLRPFLYSRNGLSVERLAAGQDLDVRDDLVEGLRDAGLVGDGLALVGEPEMLSVGAAKEVALAGRGRKGK